MAGIVAMLIASIIIRRRLRKNGALLDFSYTSCADFALFIKGIPLHYTPEKLKS